MPSFKDEDAVKKNIEQMAWKEASKLRLIPRDKSSKHILSPWDTGPVMNVQGAQKVIP